MTFIRRRKNQSQSSRTTKTRKLFRLPLFTGFMMIRLLWLFIHLRFCNQPSIRPPAEHASMIIFGNKSRCVGIKHSTSDESKALWTALDRLKKLRSPGESCHSLNWSRKILLVQMIYFRGRDIFPRNTDRSPCVLQLTFHLCFGMIVLWHSFHSNREGHCCLFLNSVLKHKNKNTKQVTFTKEDSHRS